MKKKTTVFIWLTIISIFLLLPKLKYRNDLRSVDLSFLFGPSSDNSINTKMNGLTATQNKSENFGKSNTISQREIMTGTDRIYNRSSQINASQIRSRNISRSTSPTNTAEIYVVPNIVHFIWFGRGKTWQFHQFLSVKSAFMNIKPNMIYFHCNYEPTGHWWALLKRHVKTLKIVKTVPPNDIFDTPLFQPEHKSDIYRILLLKKFGGIYLDSDVIALKSFNPLRKFRFTMGIEYHGDPGRLNNGIIVSAPDSKFLNIWLETYKRFSSNEWDFHSCAIPYTLQYLYPNLIHVEERSLNFPSGPKRELIYERHYDWSNNYAIHLWYRLDKLSYNANSIKRLDTTFGEIARFVFYNDSKMIIS